MAKKSISETATTFETTKFASFETLKQNSSFRPEVSWHPYFKKGNVHPFVSQAETEITEMKCKITES